MNRGPFIIAPILPGLGPNWGRARPIARDGLDEGARCREVDPRLRNLGGIAEQRRRFDHSLRQLEDDPDGLVLVIRQDVDSRKSSAQNDRGVNPNIAPVVLLPFFLGVA